ncbi:UNVERIFIED_CONTAM: Serine/threonine kinase [Siphonaria sp. JEL0065]|nr:Serine/threonine kinase [Siphonaria sp. JEL0065]
MGSRVFIEWIPFALAHAHLDEPIAYPHYTALTAASGKNKSELNGDPLSKDAKAIDAQIAEISGKIEVERKMLQGAQTMYRQLNDAPSREACEANMVDSKRRLEYLEGLLRDAVGLSMASQSPRPSPKPPQAISLAGGSSSSGGGPPLPAIPPRSHSNSASNLSAPPTLSPSASLGNIFRTFMKNSATPSSVNLKHEQSNSDLHSNLGGGGITPQMGLPPTTISTNFDLMKYGSAITGDKVKYRLQEIVHKLDTEQKVKTGTENLLHAMVNLNTSNVDQRVAVELRDKMAESNAKIAVLEKAKHRYSALYIAPVGEPEEDDTLTDIRRKINGRLKLKLIGASNLVGRTSNQNEIIATVAIDGNVKYTSRRSSTRWDETLDTQVDRGQEVEICVYSHPGGMLLGLVWFKLGDLEDDLKARYPNGLPTSVGDVEDTWLDLEPAGQILIRASFVGMTKAKTQRDQVFRREAVQKAFPRNGHKFYAVQSLLYQCAVCNEYSGVSTQWYQCQGCTYTCHAKCYNNVITKCITPAEIRDARPDQDLNTGQLLSYRIPHRFQHKTILLSSWCAHCGSMMGPGARIEKCAECGKCAHTGCKPMVPNFCQLKPDTAIQLVAAFEDAEKKKHAREIEEADKAEKVRREQDAALGQVAAPLDTANIFKEDDTYEKILNNAKVLEQQHLEQQTKAKSDQQKADLERLSEIERLKKRAAEEEDRRRQIIEQSKRLQDEKIRNQELIDRRPPTAPSGLKEVKLEDFGILSVLGRGAFGKVMLIEEKTTKNLYAMKALKKEFIIQSDDVASAKLEKRVFQKASQSQHPYLVNLHSCFQSDSRLYFVMEYVCGGDLMCHIQEKKRFSQVRAKFYACEVLLALEFFHQNNIIYRDLKLDNILMCPDGHIKVTDYGICKENMPYGMVTRTYCGTPDYMAPEILSQSKYGRAVDWWSFGVLIYVMLVGRYPFHGDDESDILEAIVSDSIEYPTNMPKETLQLIQSLLKKDSRSRLGGGRLDAEEVKRHAYFAGVDWALFMEKKVPPPWKPNIKNERDVSNFDAEFTKERPVLTPVNTVLSAANQAEFKDFDFIAAWAGV